MQFYPNLYMKKVNGCLENGGVMNGLVPAKFETHSPAIIRTLLSKYTLHPLYILQKMLAKYERALVLYL